MVKHHAYLQLYPKSVCMIISSKTIMEQMFPSKSQTLKGPLTVEKPTESFSGYAQRGSQQWGGKSQLESRGQQKVNPVILTVPLGQEL